MNGNIETKLLIIIPINIYIYISINELVEASIGRSSEAVSGPLLLISFKYPCDVSQYVHDIFTSEFTTSKMLKRRSSVRNCCRIESSNRLNSIFIKFNFFIFFNIFVRGARAPGALPLDPPLHLHLFPFLLFSTSYLRHIIAVLVIEVILLSGDDRVLYSISRQSSIISIHRLVP